jgi:hypothetical protein
VTVALDRSRHEETRRLSASERLPCPWMFPLGVFALTWVVILLAWWTGDVLRGQHCGWQSFFSYKDSAYFLGIAHDGYPATLPREWVWNAQTVINGRVAFFPGLPLLIRAAALLTGGAGPEADGESLHAALVAMLICGAGAAVGVWAVARQLRGTAVADRAVLLFCAFPGAMAFGMVYTEPLMVALGAAGILALVNRRWMLAGLAGAAATLTGALMLAFTVAAAVAAAQEIRRPETGHRRWLALAAPALSMTGFLGYMAYLWVRYDRPLVWFWVMQSGWGQHWDFGLQTLRIVFWLQPVARHAPVYDAFITAAFVVGLIGIAAMIRARLPWSVTAFGIAAWYIAVASNQARTTPRMVWLGFPIFIGLAAKLPRRAYWPVVIVFTLALGLVVSWWLFHQADPSF